MNSPQTPATGGGAFPVTQWTRVLAAGPHGAENAEEAGEALRSLCEAYYAPVMAFLRQSGRPEDAARELTHGFFEEVLSGSAFAGADRQRGRFRTYLLGALKHFLSRQTARQLALKRGAGAEHLPVDDAEKTPESALEDVRALPPDREFDRQWALHVLRGALEDLESECARAGKAELFTSLQPFLTGEAEHGALAVLAASLKRSESTLRSELHRLRKLFRRCVRQRITPTLESAHGTDDEMTVLLQALAGG